MSSVFHPRAFSLGRRAVQAEGEVRSPSFARRAGLMEVVRLKVRPMTREAFAPFGVLIDSRGSVEIDLGEGKHSLTGATSEWRPFSFDFMARHKRTMQVLSTLASSQ